MIVDFVLTNAKAYFKGQIVDCSIAIEDGKIQKIGKETQMPKADEYTDLHNLLVLPGLIDEHVHLRDEGQIYKESFSSGTAAAAAGGFTTVFDMPNNYPVTLSADRLRNRMQLAKNRILVNVGFYSEFPSNLAEIEEIVAQGAIGFKLFTGNKVGGLNIDDDYALKQAFEAVAKQKVTLAVHAEDHIMLLANMENLKKNHKNTPRDYLRAHTEIVELNAVQRVLKLIKGIDIKLHFCHVSSKESLAAITEAKKEGETVTCEVTPNHLMLSNDDLQQYGMLVIIAPPVRDRTHVDSLWRGVEDSSVDTLGSDHAPHTLEEKASKSVWNVKAGIPGLEVTLPLMLTMIRKKRLSLNQVVSLLAEKPAEIFGLTDRGHLDIDKNADLTIIDYKYQYKINAEKFHSKAKFSPYNDWDVNGRIVKTMVNGQFVYDEGEIVAKGGVGAIVRRGIE